jgi:glutaredoxin
MRTGFVAFLLGLSTFAAVARADGPGISSSDTTGVTVYQASWCSACKALERDLRARNIPFSEIDVDDNPRAFQKARNATGQNVIPQTSVQTSKDTKWIVGADADAVERAYKEQ